MWHQNGSSPMMVTTRRSQRHDVLISTKHRKSCLAGAVVARPETLRPCHRSKGLATCSVPRWVCSQYDWQKGSCHLFDAKGRVPTLELAKPPNYQRRHGPETPGSSHHATTNTIAHPHTMTERCARSSLGTVGSSHHTRGRSPIIGISRF